LRLLSTPCARHPALHSAPSAGSVRTSCSSRWRTCRRPLRLLLTFTRIQHHPSLRFRHTIRLRVPTPHRSGLRLSASDLLTFTSTLHTSSLSGIRNRRHNSPIRKQPQTPGMSAGKFRRHRELRDGPRGQSDGNVWAIERQWKTVSRGREDIR
jgi:hypothetical protein